MPRRLGDLEVPAHLLQRLPGRELLVALSQLADYLIRRVPSALRGHGDAVPPCPFSGIGLAQHLATTRGPPHSHNRWTDPGIRPLTTIRGVPGHQQIWWRRVDVSVIIATYNGAPFIGRQLDSILNQVCAGEWEVIVADNGSTDMTRDIVLAYSQREIRLRLVDASQRKSGQAHARNVGVDIPPVISSSSWTRTTRWVLDMSTTWPKRLQRVPL